MKRILSITLVIITLLIESAFSQDSLKIKKIFNWASSNTTIYNEIWGFVENGREYAVMGAWAGTYFFDVTDPANTLMVDYIPGNYQYATRRDYHDYGGYLYMVTDQDTGKFKIADLSYLPDSVSIVYSSDALFSTSHNIFIDSSSALLYTCGGNNNNGLRVFSLADPVNPVEVVNFQIPGGIHDVYVRNDTAYAHGGNPGMYVYDFATVTAPQPIGELSSYSSSVAYNHSGWLTQDGNTYVFADETENQNVKVADVSDLMNITILDEVNSGGDTDAVAHNVIVKGDFAYVSYYHDGLWIYDISNPSDTKLAGFYDTYTAVGDTIGWMGAWGVYPLLPSGIILVSDRVHGLYVLDASEAEVVGLEEELQHIEFFISPNPVIDQLTMYFEEQVKIQSVQVIDLTGRVVYHSETEIIGHTIDFSVGNLNSGNYLLHVTTDKGTFASKITKATD